MTYIKQEIIKKNSHLSAFRISRKKISRKEIEEAIMSQALKQQNISYSAWPESSTYQVSANLIIEGWKKDNEYISWAY